jgi:hypothetical protein
VNPLTQLRPGAIPGGRYVALSNKGPGGAHPVGALTRLWPGAMPGTLYGSFAVKSPGKGSGGYGWVPPPADEDIDLLVALGLV